MAIQTAVNAQHATLTTTTSDQIVFSGSGLEMAVTNRDASTTLYFRQDGLNERQTITLTAGAEADTFKLTWNGNESSSAVTIPAGGFANVTAAQIATCLDAITGITATDVSVTGSGGAYVVEWIGDYRSQDVGAITITSKVGAADGSVAETTKGGSAVAAADNNIVVLPLQTKVVPYKRNVVSVVGNGNAYSVEIF